MRISHIGFYMITKFKSIHFRHHNITDNNIYTLVCKYFSASFPLPARITLNQTLKASRVKFNNSILSSTNKTVNSYCRIQKQKSLLLQHLQHPFQSIHQMHLPFLQLPMVKITQMKPPPQELFSRTNSHDGLSAKDLKCQTNSGTLR